MTLLERTIYLQRISPYIGTNLIKVITGQRRTGKSYFLKQVISLIEDASPETQIVYINKEDFEFDNITNYQQLIEYVKSTQKKAKIALFIDEIQEISEFERALRHFLLQNSIDIYCTGSNSSLLSGDLATLLSGRSIEIEIFSLSYKEFLQFHKLTESTENFEKYLIYGGMPNLIHLPMQDEQVFNYLKNVYNTIVVRDVIERHQIRNAVFLRNLTKFIADNTGSIVSAKSISDFLKSQQMKVSPELISEYLLYLCEAFFLFKVQRSDINGKKIFEIGEKYYFNDCGLRNSMIGYKATDINKLLENIVYLHLRIAGYNVTVGHDRNKEIDFLAQKEGNILYIQVCYLLEKESTINREFGNLLKISNNYPKWVISMDISSKTSYEGIEHYNIREFCLNILS